MSYRDLIARWGIDIRRPLLRQALTHRSFAFEHDEPHNERLEFLGDSILNLITAEKVYREFPNLAEGVMTPIKWYAASEKGLADIARQLGLGEFVRLGKGAAQEGGSDKDSILSDTVEALIAATYLQHGMEPTRAIVDRLIDQKVKEAAVLGPQLDWRASFEELAHEHGFDGNASFEITGVGPDHSRIYTATIMMGGRTWGTGEATTKKVARQAAAEASYKMLAEDELERKQVRGLPVRADMLAARG